METCILTPCFAIATARPESLLQARVRWIAPRLVEIAHFNPAGIDVNWLAHMQAIRRLIWCLIALCLATIICAGQDKTDSNQGNNSTPAAQADRSSEAYVIENREDRWKFNDDGTASRDEMVRARIQSDAGVQRFGLLMFPYQKSTETVEINYVRVHKADGSVVPTSVDEAQDMAAGVSREAPFYSDLREKHLAVKGLSIGDMVEYQCHWNATKPLVPGQFWMSFDFDDEEIVLHQKVEVGVPRNRQVKVKSPSDAPVISENGSDRVYTWTHSNLTRKTHTKLELAQLVVTGTFPGPDIQLSSFRSWEEVGRWYDGLQRERSTPSPEIRAKAAELTRNAPDELAKIQAIYKYVSTEFRYIGVAFGIGRYQPHSAAEVLSNQYGDCKDKHTLLASLLAAAGIAAYPALINSSHMIDTELPSPSQFNHLITVVPRGKELLWLDSTLEVGPLGYLSPVLRNKAALIIHPEKPASFETTPVSPPFPASWIFKMDATLDSSGTLHGRVEQTVRGDIEVIWRAGLRSLPRAQWKDLIQQISYQTGFAGDVSDVTVSSPEATEAPLHFTYTYTRKKYPDWENHRITAPAPEVVHAPMEEDGKLPPRYWLGAPGEFQFESRVQVPKDYSPDLPHSKDLIQPFVEYHSTFAFQDNTLIARFRTVLKKVEVAGDDVKQYKEFAEKVFEDRNQYIPLSSANANSLQNAAYAFQRRVSELPDSKDAKAAEAEQDARTAAQSRSYQGAIDALNRAVRLDPKFTRAWVLLGQMYMGGMQAEPGLHAFRSAVDCDPKQPLPYKFLAFALTSIARRTEAIQVWQNLAKVAPDDQDIASNMGSLLVAEKRYSDAIPYLESAAKLYPDRPQPIAELGTAYLNSGADDKAAAAFAKVFQLQPGAGAKNNIAYLLANAHKRLDDALRYAQEAVREEEDYSRKVHLDSLAFEDLIHIRSLGAYWDTLGWVHYQLGNFKEAEGYLYAAWTLGQHTVIGYHLAQTYEKMHRNQDAAHMYRLVAEQPSLPGEDSDAVAGSKKSLTRLHVPLSSPRVRGVPLNSYVGELSEQRTIKLPRIARQASAEFFLLFAPGVKVEDTRFISGSEQLRSAGKMLSELKFKIAFPEGSSARLVRRGILACFPLTGCSFVLIPPESTQVN